MLFRNNRKEMKPQATANGLEPIQQEPNIVVRYLVIANLYLQHGSLWFLVA